jgi:protein phosphatase
MNIEIPELSLVLLIGASSSGKSTFANRHFSPSEIVSSDALRKWVSDNENDQAASGDAFDLLYRIVAMRLKRGLLTVVDATNARADDRRPLLRIARDQFTQPVAIVFDLPEQLSQDRNRSRADRDVPPEVIRRHTQRSNARWSA